ncbi:MAG: DUF1015 domain-containing protein [Anaerosomatales bacterium]|nr:DUF1015 domain-containing protein [Anaerosomatales bacterium]MDT8433142.1 DUF1015 domain-containing protein [Anaerosomatales bacterium]
MARFRPFKAYTYARTTPDISDLTAPPYDVISEKQRSALLSRSPSNVVALELPEGSLDPAAEGNRYATGRYRWREWRDSGVLVRDRVPTVYVLEQRYLLDGREVRRRAFIGEVELRAFSEGVVLPHERTLPKALGDRFNLTKACAANFSQVFGLYSDPERVTDRYFEQAMSGRIVMTATDDDGVVSDVWALTDPEALAGLAAALDPKQVFIADGHHRYTTALAYRDERRAAAANTGVTPTDPAYDFVMMALVNMDDPGLVVLPTHRVADAPRDFDASRFRASLAETFELADIPAGSTPEDALGSLETPGFVVALRGGGSPFLASIRPDADLDELIPLEHSRAWKELDVAVLQELVLDRLLDISTDRPHTLERLSFVKDTGEAIAAVAERDTAFILRPTRMDQMRAVALAGETMPQKSTYFYPKLLSGLVLRTMD